MKICKYLLLASLLSSGVVIAEDNAMAKEESKQYQAVHSLSEVVKASEVDAAEARARLKPEEKIAEKKNQAQYQAGHSLATVTAEK